MGDALKVLRIDLEARASGEPSVSTVQGGNVALSVRAHALGTQRTRSILARSFLVPRRLSRYDVVITSDYFSSFGINLRLLLSGVRTKHVTVGLNQSRRLMKTGIGWIDARLDAVYRRTDLAVVHSRREAALFAELHRIPPERFYFSPWGFDLPAAAPLQFSRWSRPYVCLVGRNNRDIDTFVAAVDGLDVDGVVITAQRHRPPGPLPSNVHVFCDLPMDETLDCIRNAAASAILLKDDRRGAGHITAVAAMLAGVPQIVSDAEVIKDYLVDGHSAIAVPLGDVPAVRAAITTVLANPGYAAKLGENARDYARRWLTHAQASGRIAAAIAKVARGDKIAFADPDWLAAYGALPRVPVAH